MLLLLEILFAGVLVAGVAFVYWPAALILCGLLGIVACERASVRPQASVRPLRRGEAA